METLNLTKKKRGGWKHSEETKKKLSELHKGEKNYFFGKKFSDEHRKNLSIAQQNRKPYSPERLKKMSVWQIGRKMSVEARQKMSEAWKKRAPASIETRKRMGDSHRGSKSHFWKGGINPENMRVRRSFEMKLWTKACLERDKYTCQKTGQVGGKLRVHHINNFADFPELRTSIENGITLSLESHNLFHKKYGRRNNTREQLIEFLNNKNI